MLNFDGFVKLFKALHFFIVIFALGWAALPLILAKATELGWLGWFSILTMPTAIAMIVIVILQRKILK